MGFFKFHESMLDSSVNDQPYTVRWCWASLLALASSDSIMRVPIAAFCRRANIKPDEVQQALEYLQRPDPASRCQDHEGRRVVPVDGGLLLVALQSFREAKQHDDLRRRQAEWVAQKRSKSKPVEEVSTACRSDVDSVSTDSRQLSTLSTHTEAEAEAEADTEAEVSRAKALEHRAAPAEGTETAQDDLASDPPKNVRPPSISAEGRKLVEFIDRRSRAHCPDLPALQYDRETCIAANQVVKAHDPPRLRYAVHWSYSDDFWRGQITTVKSLTHKSNLSQLLSKSAKTWTELKDMPEYWDYE